LRIENGPDLRKSGGAREEVSDLTYSGEVSFLQVFLTRPD
jgi:hypothetical protein